jgi:hypothetical protein
VRRVRTEFGEDSGGICRVPVHGRLCIVRQGAGRGNLNWLPRVGGRGMMRGDENFVFRATAGGGGCCRCGTGG